MPHWEAEGHVAGLTSCLPHQREIAQSINHRPILSIFLFPDIQTDEGRQDDMAEDTVPPLFPVLGDLREELLEVFDRLLPRSRRAHC